MVGKIRACVAVRDQKDRDFVINARTDSFATHGIDEAIRRCQQYLEADADMVFIDAIATRKDIEQVVKSVDGLLSVNLMGWCDGRQNGTHSASRVSQDGRSPGFDPGRLGARCA